MKKQTCNECGLLLVNGKCHSCGWTSPKALTTGGNHKCVFQAGMDRCQFTGVYTDSIKADNVTGWYCREHFFVRDNPKIGAQILQLMARGEIRLDKSNWRDELLAEKMKELKKSNPELFSIPETLADRDEFQQMKIGFIKSRLRSVGKLPYNKHKQQADYEADESILTGADLVRPL